MRYAIYFTPAQPEPLTRMAANWLGRDAFTGEMFAPVARGPLGADTVARITASPRRYGFHATLKAPFRLAPGQSEGDLIAALESFAQQTPAFAVAEMVVGNIGGFFAIVPNAGSDALDDFAGRVVTAFERFRAPTTDAEIARRNPDHLSPVELSNLRDWGYPYVFESFRFHMTLSERIEPDHRAAVAGVLEEMFDPILPTPFPIEGLALFVEPEPGAPFRVRSFVRLGATVERKSA